MNIALKLRKSLASRQAMTVTSSEQKINVFAADVGIPSLQILRDGDAMKMIQRMYAEYISDEDYSKFFAFAVKLDQLMLSLGAKPGNFHEENSETNKESEKQQEEKEFG